MFRFRYCKVYWCALGRPLSLNPLFCVTEFCNYLLILLYRFYISIPIVRPGRNQDFAKGGEGGLKMENFNDVF